METSNNRQRVAVIGGGLAGLAAALYLARSKSMDVHVFERSAVPGGRARTTEKNGLLFNLGAHALYARGAAHGVLDELGIPYVGGMPALTGNEFIVDGRRLTMPTGAGTLLAHADFTLRVKWELLRVFIALQSAGKNPTGGDRAQQSARAWLHRLCRSPRVRQFFEGMFRLTTYAADLNLLSADAAIAQFRQSGSGVIYLDGGWQTLIEGLARANRALGTKLHTNAGVANLQRTSNGRVALRFARETPIGMNELRNAEFDCVLLACDPTNAARLARDLDVRVDGGKVIPVRAACFDVGLTSLSPSMGLVLDLDRRLYLSVHSNSARLVSDSVRAKHSGAALIQLAKYLHRDESPDDARAEMESLLDTVQPGWRTRVIEAQYLPRIAVAQDLPDATRGGLAGRTRVDHGADAGVYFAGDWVGDHGLLSDAALASARLAAERILARPIAIQRATESLPAQHLIKTGAVAFVR